MPMTKISLGSHQVDDVFKRLLKLFNPHLRDVVLGSYLVRGEGKHLTIGELVKGLPFVLIGNLTRKD